jgi:hypothetical protein
MSGGTNGRSFGVGGVRAAAAELDGLPPDFPSAAAEECDTIFGAGISRRWSSCDGGDANESVPNGESVGRGEV